MTVKEATEYLENYPIQRTKYGLERIRALMELLGNPQKGMKYIHVVGSNGKGSTCAFLESVLRCAGYRTGLYSSPDLVDYKERFQVMRKNASGRAFAKAARMVKQAAEKMEETPSWFEISTAVAFLYFKFNGCDIVVLEAGMGGMYDATNVIDAPEVAVVTNIGLEHTQYLGNTLREIASTKAGIIKPGCSTVCYDSDPEVTKVIREVSAGVGSECTVVDFSSLKTLSETLDGQTFLYRGTEYRIGLIGRHQTRNAATALETLFALRKKGWAVSDEQIAKGLRTAKWPARFEVLSKDPLFILDGGHNPQCAEATADAVRTFLPGVKPVFLTGTLADKDYKSVTGIIGPLAEEFICLTPLSDRALDAKQYAEFLRGEGFRAREYEDVRVGIREALTAGKDTAVVAFGSLYLAGAVRSQFPGVYRNWSRKDRMEKRRNLPEEERKQYSERITEKLLQSDVVKNARTVMLYHTIRGEVESAGLEEALMRAGKTVAFPVCEDNGEMTAWVPSDPGAWKKSCFGMPEPDAERSTPVAMEQIDLVICPCTAFDAKCNRMGRGSGCYDKFLEKCPEAVTVGVAFELQRVDSLPVKKWDLPMDMVVTETAVYRKKRK